jgi:hypothetical protein
VGGDRFEPATLRCKRGPPETRYQGEFEFLQFSRLISHLSTLPLIAVNCSDSRSPRGPTTSARTYTRWVSKEEDARNIISHALGLPVRVTDIQTHRGLHDLEIDLPDGSAETVEVTTLTDQDLERLYGSQTDKLDIPPSLGRAGSREAGRRK